MSNWKGKVLGRSLVHVMQAQSRWWMLWWSAATITMTPWACWAAPTWMLASTPSLCRTSPAFRPSRQITRASSRLPESQDGQTSGSIELCSMGAHHKGCSLVQAEPNTEEPNWLIVGSAPLCHHCDQHCRMAESQLLYKFWWQRSTTETLLISMYSHLWFLSTCTNISP